MGENLKFGSSGVSKDSAIGQMIISAEHAADVLKECGAGREAGILKRKDAELVAELESFQVTADADQKRIAELETQLKAAREHIRPLHAGHVPSKPVNARLLEHISEAVSSYERHGGVCTFEGEPMIHALTLLEIAEVAAEAKQAGPVRLASEQINDCLEKWRGCRYQTYERLAWIIEAASLRANGFPVKE